jgi:NADH:ubiquinone oxidoreductase subunit E
MEESKMISKTNSCCCCGTEDNDALLRRIADIAAEYRDKEGSLIQVLHLAQGIYGYLPTEVQTVIADALGIPLSEVSGVVTFYSFFSTQPRGEHTIRVCLGTACYVRGGKKIIERLSKLLDVKVGDTTSDRKFTFEVARCIGACGLAPVMSIDDVVYKQVSPEKLETILARYYQKEGDADER